VTPYIGSNAQPAKTVTGSPPDASTTVTGLTTGTTYTFTVQAANRNGGGPESAPSNAVTPLSAVAPTAPTGVSATPATQSVRVTWTPPSSDGDSAITGYTITPYIGTDAQTAVQAGASATSATVTGLANGTAYTFKVTATNGVGDSPASAASNPATPQSTIFDLAAPSVADSGDTSAIEVGVKFTADYSGSITGIRFYKTTANTGTHTGSLWSTDGTRLAQATFTGETATGWQTATFATPVAVTAGTTYIASYYAPKGHYSVTTGSLASAVNNPPLHTVANATSANGVFAYAATSSFPNRSYQASNYWVDVLFAPPPPPGAVAGVTATAGRASATVSWSAPSSGGPVTSYKVTPYIGSNAQPAKTVTGSPPTTSATVTGLTPGTAYTFTVQAANPGGSGAESARSAPVTPLDVVAPASPTAVTAQGDTKSAVVSWTPPADDGGSAITSYTVTPFAGSTALTPVRVDAPAARTRVTGLANGTSYTFKVRATNAAGSSPDSGASQAVTPQSSIFELGTPAVVDGGDAASVVLGVKLTADVAGSVTGIRFYKAAANTGTHTGALWTAGGQLLASGTFSNESASGWQTLTFATPVPIAAKTTYVASYLAPKGHYSLTNLAFAAGAVDNPPLHAVANRDSPDGVFSYSTSSIFPTSSFNSANYWVDVLFAPGA
jgi:hypothetical protein